MFLTTLKVIRTDYEGLRDQKVSRDKWNSLQARLDVLSDEISGALARATRIEGPRNGDRIVTLQKRIDDERINEHLSLTDVRLFQARLDSIRNDYLRTTERGRIATNDERADISSRLDALEQDLNRSR
jgi:hypothetical protein